MGINFGLKKMASKKNLDIKDLKKELSEKYSLFKQGLKRSLLHLAVMTKLVFS